MIPSISVKLLRSRETKIATFVKKMYISIFNNSLRKFKLPVEGVQDTINWNDLEHSYFIGPDVAFANVLP